MRKHSLTLAATILLVGCGGSTPPSAYEHSRDQIFAIIPLPMVDSDFVPCFRTVNGQPGRLSDAECYRLTDPQRMRGVAKTGFETGSFYPGQTTLPKADERSDFWVELDPRVLPRDIRSRCNEGCAVYLDFLGRRTAVQGRYGHMGLAKHIVIVDRVFAVRVLE